MRGLLQDLRYALRQFRKSPAFIAIAVLTLALGIGANTAVFSVMNAALLRSLPVRDSGRLHYLEIESGNQPPGASNTGNDNTSFSEPVFEALRQRHDVFDDLIAYVPLALDKVAVRYGDTPEEAAGYEVSGNFFSGLTALIVCGRGLTLEDEKNHAQVAVISDWYWNRRFARSPAVLGSTLYVKGVPFTIIGVTAPHFNGVGGATISHFWIPLQIRPELNAWGIPAELNTLYGTPKWWCLMLMARLRTDVTPSQAQTALQSTFLEAAKIGVGNIDPKQWKPLLDFNPARGLHGGEQYRDQVRILMGLVLLVLLIASTNVALMLMARNEARQREFSLRMAIGAGKQHVLRQLLTESSLLVLAGAALGWLFAIFATRALASWSQIESGLDPDRNMLLFTLCTSVLVALVFGLAPMRVAVRAPISGVLKATTVGMSQSRERGYGGRVLMSSQVAICLLLLVAAGLLLRTLRRYQTEDLGMKADGLLVFGLTPQRWHTAQETYAFYRNIVDRIRDLPGVDGVTIMENRLGLGWSDNNDVLLDGLDLQSKYGSEALIRSNTVGPDYFRVLGVPLLQGRDISDADSVTAPLVVVVNETFAKRFLANTNALGHKLNRDFTIVGVAKDSKYTGVSEPSIPMVYYASFQGLRAGQTMHVEVRYQRGQPMGLPTLARAVHENDPDVPLQHPATQLAQFESSYAQPAMFARLGGFFGGLAALLVATGLYGTLAYRTNRRTTEIGVRMALGAERRQVLWQVMCESLLISAIGVVVGLPLTLACSRLMDSMLYELSPFDSASFVLAVCSIALVGSVAAFIPAWRAGKVDPMVALRYE
jgi:predicted permease